MSDDADTNARLVVLEWAVRQLMIDRCLGDTDPDGTLQKLLTRIHAMTEMWSNFAVDERTSEAMSMNALSVAGQFDALIEGISEGLAEMRSASD